MSLYDFSSRSWLPKTFDAQGHRGARGLKPENTLPAFEAALDLGVDTLEMDLHLTRDGVVVVWHDPVLDPAKCDVDKNTSAETRLLSSHTLQQLQTYTFDRNPEPQRFTQQENGPTPLAGSDYRITPLSDLFDFVQRYSQSPLKSEAQRKNAAQVEFNIETKRVPAHPECINDGFDGVTAGLFERSILEIVAQHNIAERVVIQSFDHRSLAAIRKIDKTIRLSALTGWGQLDFERYVAIGANIWSPGQHQVTAESVLAAHAVGLLVLPWTVNDPQKMLHLIQLGVDGMISDRPDLLLSIKVE